MAVYRPFSAEDAVAAAAASLSLAEGQRVSMTDVQDLGGEQRRNIVLRAQALQRGRAPRSVIVKATRAADYDSSAPDAFEKSGLVKEWAATTLLAIDGSFTTLLAADTRQGVLVLADLGRDLPSLVKPLLHGSAAEAETALAAYAVSLAHPRVTPCWMPRIGAWGFRHAGAPGGFRRQSLRGSTKPIVRL